MTERTLVQAAQSGRSEATDELIERYYPRVYSFVSAQKPAADAEDLTQEVFARALRALPRFNGEYQFGAWLLQIARNVCIDEARRSTRRPQPTDPVDLVELETQFQPDHVWESVSAQIAVTTVHKALARLPKRQRTVLVLRELEGMSYADIAIAQRISTRAVEISLSRARKRMRVELAGLDLAEEEMAECRRMASILATDPAAMSREDVAAHLRTCRLCQARARRRPRQVMRAILGFLTASPARLAQALASAPGTATLSPLSRLAEMGASVAVATAVSAGAFTSPAVATAPPIAVPVSVPMVAAPAGPVETTAAPAPAPGDSDGQGSASAPAPAPAAAVPALPIVSSLPCALTNLSKVLQQPAAGGAATPAGVTPGSGNLLSELLSPVNSLSPVLACDPTLAHVAGVVKALSGQKPAGVPAPAKAGPAAPAPQGIDLFALLQQLLGLTPSPPSPH
ncbi:MAG: sigma-70 family RNA polymerase sigma factor [Actinobacteria bacterium]|nr:MAG: sigma-70 family RNA polymerase sigma factor [Actinomycetota bacterium]